MPHDITPKVKFVMTCLDVYDTTCKTLRVVDAVSEAKESSEELRASVKDFFGWDDEEDEGEEDEGEEDEDSDEYGDSDEDEEESDEEK